MYTYTHTHVIGELTTGGRGVECDVSVADWLIGSTWGDTLGVGGGASGSERVGITPSFQGGGGQLPWVSP